MVGDVNIYMNDLDNPQLAEVEIMIAEPKRYLLFISSKNQCATSYRLYCYCSCFVLHSRDWRIKWSISDHRVHLMVDFCSNVNTFSGWKKFCGNAGLTLNMQNSLLLSYSSTPCTAGVIMQTATLHKLVALNMAEVVHRPMSYLDQREDTSVTGKHKKRELSTMTIFAFLGPLVNGTTFNHVWQAGSTVSNSIPQIHSTSGPNVESLETLDFLQASSSNSATQQRQNPKDSPRDHKRHRLGVLLPVGAVTARYLRQVQSLGPSWFYVHSSIQLAAFFLGTVGFAMGIRLGELSPGVVYGMHRKLGFAAFCLGALQTVALLFRPKTTNKFRKYWKSYHHFVGYACVVLGVVNVFQGFEVMGEGRSYAKLGYCLCLSTLVGVCIALEVNSWVVFCRKCKEDKMRREGLIGGGGGGSSSI
ncbi:hypothetical protein JRO89_XS01G0123900 [Xanthoceras sorbifolium]|uniref:Cytochrome b561 and DOMON domain-containing protein n=1 Tax=Xanthoceras sorbifolium TaxID=99658 RepID=A0ABQ8IIZ4_9ROSI|nr:hypothetical protein JRO89_XS01G0123900 [Xanthoceras sorbifolium]